MVAVAQSRWFRRGAKGELLPALLAMLPLTAKVAEEQALCLNSVLLQPATAEGGAYYLTVLILTVMALVVSCFFGWWLRGRCERKPRRRDVRAQSQTTYTYHIAQPPSQPLAERDTEAWSKLWTW